MNWQDKVYESLITEKRSEASRRRTSLRKRGAEMEKRKATGKSIGAYGAGTRARTAKAQARKASKPAMWHAKRHYEGEAERLIAHGKNYKANQKAANAAKVAEAKVTEKNVYDLEPSNPTSVTVGNKLPDHILKRIAKAKEVTKSKKKKK